MRIERVHAHKSLKTLYIHKMFTITLHIAGIKRTGVPTTTFMVIKILNLSAE